MRLTLFAILFVLSGHCFAADPTQEINRHIASSWKSSGIKPASRCSDREFARRVYLDLAGRIPTPSEAQTFLTDDRQLKRKHLVQQLLESEDHVQHFADVFDTILMGRAEEDTYGKRTEHGWRSYLEAVFRENRRWDEVAKEVLLARPANKDKIGSVWFLYERENDHQAIAEAVAPAFFGIRIECAQCHDHMIADEIEQAHYWGLVAFFNRGKNQKTSNGPRVAESAIGGFSEFANLEGTSTPNLLTFFDSRTVYEKRPGQNEKQEDATSLYVSADVSGDPREPIFSRRQKFVTQVLSGHPLLARAMVNRIWAVLMGRGIVHPHDELDSAHPPSHPKLLDWLAEDFASKGFDVRRLVKSVVLCDAYQLRSIPPSPATPPEAFAWYLERPLTAEQLARSIQLALRGAFQNDALLVKTFRQQILDVLPNEIEIPVADALFFSNNTRLDEYIRRSSGKGQLIKRLERCNDAEARAALLTETFFCRPPGVDEVNAIRRYISDRESDVDSALSQVVWSMIGSAEFRFNH